MNKPHQVPVPTSIVDVGMFQEKRAFYRTIQKIKIGWIDTKN
jgi:hypothetical protein